MVYSIAPDAAIGLIWNTHCGCDEPVEAPLPTPTGATQLVKLFSTCGERVSPMFAHVLAVNVSPRLTTKGPTDALKNLEIAPSLPNIRPISALLASMVALAVNGYLLASVF